MNMRRCFHNPGFLRILAILGFILILIVPQGARPAAAGSALTIADATGFARAHLMRETEVIPEWEGAILQGPVVHYDLKGQRAAYVFSLLRGGQEVGYITVSAVTMENPILEFGLGPALVKANRFATLANENALTEGIDFEHPLYLGALAYFYRVDAKDGPQLLAMDTGERIRVPGEPVILPAEKQPVAALHEETRQILPLAGSVKLLAGPDYDWYHGCGPTAVANLIGYYADRGFPNLIAGGSRGNYLAAIDELAWIMDTKLPEGWTWMPIDDDIQNYTRRHGYYFTSYEITEPSFGDLMGEINRYHPVIVLVNGHQVYGDHFITAFGYQYDPANPGQNFMIVHDTWGSTPRDAWVQFGAGYSGMWMDTAEPPVGTFTPDVTPPSSQVRALVPYQESGTFTVSWSGADTGFGIESYDIQYRDGNGGPWQDWYLDTTLTSAEFTGQTGHTYYFRARARDIDHNLEAYPLENGDTSTTVADYVVGGYVWTNRGEPVMNATVSAETAALSPVLSNVWGKFGLPFMNYVSAYTISIVGPDNTFGSLPPRADTSSLTGKLLNFYLPPADNLVQNGQFEESQMTGWNTGGDIPPVLKMTAHTGTGALMLGNSLANSGSSSIQQDVNIPAEMTSPTLSFVYQWTSNTPSAGQFTVQVSDKTNTVTVELSPQGEDWGLQWVDLSEFAGKTVTIQFQLKQTGDSNHPTVLLDEVSLGSALRGAHAFFLPTLLR